MNILLIQLKRIGDLILTTPAILAIKERFPEAKIFLAVSHEVSPLIPALPPVDNVLVMRRSIADMGRLSSIALTRFEYSIDLTRNNRSALISLLSRANKRIVSYRVKGHAPFRGYAYNEFIEHRMRDMHTIDYNLSLLEPLGINPLPRPPVSLSLPSNATHEAERVLTEARVGIPYLLVHPGSARAEKFWEPARWVDVITYALEREKVDVVMTGGSSRVEQSHLAEIMGLLPRPQESSSAARLVNLSGKIDLLTLAALIGRARLLLTVDSAPVHIAAALQVPQVALFGPTNPFHWRPRDSAAIILQGDSNAPVREFVPKQNRLPMKLISTQAVIDAMNALLSTPAA